MYRPECLPSHDFEWEFVRYYSRDQISAAVVSGKLLIVDGLPISWDEREFMRDALAAAPRVTETPGLTRVHGPSGNHRPLTEPRHEMVNNQHRKISGFIGFVLSFGRALQGLDG